jgi:BirA family transcriptional regulator, biotin operon repressor / biotin---[acetyl-CoA-carboxylase] ligase
MDEDVLRRALRSAGIPDAPARYEDVVDSTNAVALRMAADGAPEWTVVAAGHQTAGRGRLGRRWESNAGQGLLFSFLLRPRLPAATVPLITLLAGTAMVEACAQAGVRAACKWPNDLLVEGAKVGGILAEGRVSGDRFEHVVVGVGMNVGSTPPGLEGAGALPPLSSERLLGSFFVRFLATYRYPERFAASVLEGYRPVCSTLGRRVRARTASGDVVEGVAVDVDAEGSLVLDAPGSRRAVAFGEVFHLR